jgi:hypothetical protein
MKHAFVVVAEDDGMRLDQVIPKRVLGLSGNPLKPSLLPKPAFPAENTSSNGCEPVTPGNASRTAAS